MDRQADGQQYIGRHTTTCTDRQTTIYMYRQTDNNIWADKQTDNNI